MQMDTGDDSIKRESRLAVFEHVVEKKKPKSQKRFCTYRSFDDSSPSESELVIDEDEGDDAKTVNNGHASSVRVRVREEPLSLNCEWSYCYETFECFKKFCEHLTYHVSCRNTQDEVKCLWRDCPTPKVSSVQELLRHVCYHGYLTKLKCIGENVLRRNSLPDCKLKESYSVKIPFSGYLCEWAQCFFNFNAIGEFLEHVIMHIFPSPSDKCAPSTNELIPCEWSGCSMKFKTKHKLADHVRVHSKEKAIACPTCGSLFSTKTRFCDHRTRQLKDNLRSYQCSQCLKLFPSERLLSDHMRSHINQYKCTKCDMTSAKPSILAKHYRFRHMNERPFKCGHCSKKFVTKNNLQTHLLTHDEKNVQKCEQCDFSCKTKFGLEKHYTKKHDKVAVKYECHVCKLHFTRGDSLTKHLIKLHKFHWPSGHSRFRYRKDQDGICRLQTVRYESLEVTEEMIRSESMQPTTNMPARTYNVTYDKNQQGYKLRVVENPNVQDVTEVEQESVSKNNVIVTLDDVDMDGNLIKSTVIQEGGVLLIDAKNLPPILEESSGKISPKENLEESDSNCETNATENQASESKDIDEDVHYFSKDIIMNYTKFKIETPKSES